jgi:hypothetical protein
VYPSKGTTATLYAMAKLEMSEVCLAGLDHVLGGKKVVSHNHDFAVEREILIKAAEYYNKNLLWLSEKGPIDVR